MRKIFFLTALLCASMMSFAINWNSYEWIGDGAGGGAYSEKYKLAPAEGQAVVNIQKPGFAAEAGIYTTFPAGISTCSLGDKCAIQGAGIVLYLSAFTAQETEVTVEHGLGTSVFTVYYVDGTPSGTPAKGDPELSLNAAEVTLDAAASETFQIIATRNGEGAISFESSNASIASVNEAGLVSALSRGTATITVKVAETEDYEADVKKLTVVVEGPIDWNTIEWLGNGSGNDAYTNKYKVCKGSPSPNVINIQQPGWEGLKGPGIYTEYPSADFRSFSTTEFFQQGAGLLFYIDAFKAEFTDVTVNVGGTDYVFTVYFVDGTKGETTGMEAVNSDVKARKMMVDGQLIIEKNGVRYDVLGNIQ